MADSLQLFGNSQALERRARPRQRVLFSSLQVDDGNGGIVVNVSERGLAMQLVRNVTTSTLPRIRFRLSQSKSCIETAGRVVWMSESQKQAGVEFIALPDESRALIQEWISSIPPAHPSSARPVVVEKSIFAAPKPPVATPARPFSLVAPKVAAPSSQNQSQLSTATPLTAPLSDTSLIHGIRPTAQDIHAALWKPPFLGNSRGKVRAPFYVSYLESKRAKQRRAGQLVGILVLALIFPACLVYLALHFRGSTSGISSTEATVLANAPEKSSVSSASSVTPKSSALPAVDPASPLATAGLVLQVAAMKHEDNARALADFLRQMKFPVFVWRRADDHFFRVVIGPYVDSDTTLRVKNELKSQGYDTIVMPWKPTDRQ